MEEYGLVFESERFVQNIFVIYRFVQFAVNINFSIPFFSRQQEIVCQFPSVTFLLDIAERFPTANFTFPCSSVVVKPFS